MAKPFKWTYKGKAYGFPLEAWTVELFYNTKKVDELGVKVPDTLQLSAQAFDELVKKARAKGWTPLALGVGLAWRSPYRLVLLAFAALVAALIVNYWQVLERNFPLVYLLEDVGFYALLSLTFARSLARGRVPLCTHWADLVHGPLPPLVARYTRKTTVAWAVFFALIAAASFTLYVFAPLRILFNISRCDILRYALPFSHGPARGICH